MEFQERKGSDNMVPATVVDLSDSRTYRVGDWVQSRANILDDDTFTEIARESDLGHVIADPDAEGWVFVRFMRTGVASICHPEELAFVADAETGRTMTQRGSAYGN